MPNGFSMITRRAVAEPKPAELLDRAGRRIGGQREVVEDAGVARRVRPRAAAIASAERLEAVADARRTRSESAKRSQDRRRGRVCAPEPRPTPAPARGTPRSRPSLRAAPIDAEALRHQARPRARWNIPGSSLRFARSPVAPNSTMTWSSGIAAPRWLGRGACGGDAHGLRLTDERAWRRPDTAYPGRADGGRQTAAESTYDRGAAGRGRAALLARYLGVRCRPRSPPSGASRRSDFGPVQATVVGGAAGGRDAEPGARRDRAGRGRRRSSRRRAASGRESRGVSPYVPVTPERAGDRRRPRPGSPTTASPPATAG